MSSNIPGTNPEYTETIYLVYCGINGQPREIKKAFEYLRPALQWCSDQLAMVNSTRAALTEPSADGKSWEVAIWSSPRSGSTGYTIMEKDLTLVGLDDLPVDGSLVHAVCEGETLEVHYVGTDLEKASEMCRGKTGAVVKSVGLSRGGAADIAPTVFK